MTKQACSLLLPLYNGAKFVNSSLPSSLTEKIVKLESCEMACVPVHPALLLISQLIKPFIPILSRSHLQFYEFISFKSKIVHYSFIVLNYRAGKTLINYNQV